MQVSDRFPIAEVGAYVVSGEEYELDNSGPEDLVVVVVEAPQEDGAANTPLRRTVRYADRPALPAGPDREFRYLVNQDVGCRDITQFLGLSRRVAHRITAIFTTRSSTSSMEKAFSISAGSRG